MTIPVRHRTIPAERFDATLAAHRALPTATHSQFPQYAGHWDDWILVVLRRNVECKGGRALEFWQITIGQRQPADDLGPEHWTVYSPQRDSNIGRIPIDDVVEVTPA